MGVYSELKKTEQEYIEKIYDIKILEINFIDLGILNSNFLITVEKKDRKDLKKYILRIFEAKRTLEEEEKELWLLENISEFLPVPQILKNKYGENITIFNQKKISLFEYIEGEELLEKNINQNFLREIARYLGKLHRFSKNIEKKDFDRKSRINLDFYLSKIKEKNVDFEGKEKIFSLAKELEKINFSDLPSGIIHSDIFPDNIIVKNGSINGIIDFNEAHYAPFIYDIAIIINFWIRMKKYTNFQIENDIIRDFLNNYSQYRKIEKNEVKFLDYACKKMALTFIVLRIYKEKIEKSYEKALKIEKKSYISLMNLIE